MHTEAAAWGIAAIRAALSNKDAARCKCTRVRTFSLEGFHWPSHMQLLREARVRNRDKKRRQEGATIRGSKRQVVCGFPSRSMAPSCLQVQEKSRKQGPPHFIPAAAAWPPAARGWRARSKAQFFFWGLVFLHLYLQLRRGLQPRKARVRDGDDGVDGVPRYCDGGQHLPHDGINRALCRQQLHQPVNMMCSF